MRGRSQAWDVGMEERGATPVGQADWFHRQMFPGSNVSRTLARTGVDWVLVDCEPSYSKTPLSHSQTNMKSVEASMGTWMVSFVRFVHRMFLGHRTFLLSSALAVWLLEKIL